MGTGELLVLGIDTGLKSFGMAPIQVFLDPLHPDPAKAVGVKILPDFFSYQFGRDKEERSKSSDVAYAAETAWREIDRHWPNGRVLAVAVEGMSFGPDMARQTLLQIGIGWGLFLGEAARHHVPVFQRHPMTVKKWLTGKKTASKLEIQDALTARYNVDFGTMPKGKREHVADAIAVGLCVAETEPLVHMTLKALHDPTSTEVLHP
jgi:Holliday junction resolvasome RuvABC endonuclease subunit